MKFYNITFDLTDRRKILVPCIPETAGATENKTISRVCLSKTLEGCIQAVSRRQIYKGSQLIVREANLDEQRLVNSKTLYNNKLVPDALENKEYWSLTPVTFKVYLCEILSFDNDFTLAWSCISRKDCLNIVEKYIKSTSFRKYKTSKSIYEAAMNYANANEMWDEQDLIWDDLAMLPWAQKLELKNLKVKKIKEI